MDLKQINFQVKIKDPKDNTRDFPIQRAYTNDLNSVRLTFEMIDTTAAELTGATASILFYMLDRSFFQDTATVTGNKVEYTLTEAQGNHAGMAQVQIMVTVGGVTYASAKRKFDIVSGLEMAVATEVMIKDWTMLTAEARAYIDDAEAAEALRAQAESGRVSAEGSRVTAESSRVTAEQSRVSAESARVTAERGRAAALAEKVQKVEELQATHNTRILPNHQVADEIINNGTAIKKNISGWITTKPTITITGISGASWQSPNMTAVHFSKNEVTPAVFSQSGATGYMKAYSPDLVNAGYEYNDAVGQEAFAVGFSTLIFMRIKNEKTGILETDDNATKIAKFQAWLRLNPLKFLYELPNPLVVNLPETMTPNTLATIRTINHEKYINTLTVAFNKPKVNNAYMTISDDDGSNNVWTQLKPLAESNNIPITIAIPSNSVGTSGKMTKEQLKTLQDTLGFEITSHSHTHADLRVLTAAGKEYELSESKRVLQSYGLNVHNFIAPFGSNDDATVRKIASRYYNCGVRVGGGINYKPVVNQYIKRVALGAHAGVNNTIDYYKSQIDEAIASNGWIVWMTHVGDPTHDVIQQQHLIDVVAYAKSLGVKIVNLQEGFEKMGNAIEILDGVTVTKDGEVYNSKLTGNLWTNLETVLKALP